MKKLFLFCALCIMLVNAWAVPARRDTMIYTQPDGTEIIVYQHGDEYFHWITNEKGEWIERNEVGDFVVVPALTKDEIAARRAAAPRNKIAQKRQASALNIAPRGLIILVNFTDVAFETDKAEIDSMLTAQSYTRDYSYTYNQNQYHITSNGSARQYFYDASYGQYNPQFDVVGPVTISQNVAYYGENDSYGMDKKPEAMICEACELVDDSVDFSLYDNDKDGVVDFVYVYYAGYGEADGGGEYTIWPHQYLVSYSQNLQLDGKQIDKYACSNELDFYSKQHTGIGTFCHEFSHVLGLPDLYVTNEASHRTCADWDILDYGSYNNDGNTPPTYSAYERFFMGWLVPRLITEPENVVLKDLGTNNEALLISPTDQHNLIGNDPNPTTFYLLENRQQSGWDKYLHGHGMMLTKIQYSSSKWYNNTVNNTATAMGVDLIEADGIAPELGNSGYYDGKTSDLFPAGNTEYIGIENHPINNIQEKNGVITFNYKNVGTSTSGNITYELNGGITNDYGWMSKNDMFQACMADCGVTTLGNLDDLKAAGDGSLATICTPLTDVSGMMALEKWDWLEAYILSVQNADANAYPLTEGAASAGWRYAIAAFFLESQRTSWPVSADFSRAGTYEAFQPTWKHGFANPTEPTSDWVLNAPYKEGYTFVGWYTTPDFSGKKVTVVNAETSGTLYAKWIEYVPTIAEVKALADDSETKVAGVVNFISGKNVYIQDATGGILVYTAETPDFNVGDKIIAKGVKDLYGGAPEVKNAVVESSESSDLFDVTVFEDLSLLLSDTEFAYFGTRIAVNGVKIVSYDSYYNPTVEDLLGNQAVCYKMVLDPIIYPTGTKVSVTAVAGWYDGFRFVGDIAGIEKVVAAKQDNYIYPVRDNKYSLANNWVISNNEDNFAANKPGNTDVVRGMGIKDGIMYFINRETESLVRVDAATGTMLAPLKITGDHLFQVQAEDGTYTDAVTYKFNDLKFDNAGNCLIGALVMAGTKCQPFIVYSVNLETGVATELINDVLWDNPDIDGIQFRFDAFGVYGDVTKNAVIMAADQNSWNVFRWQIKNGVVGKGELISIELNPERDNYLASTATDFGIAPQIAPQDEYGSIFYVDGYNTLPMLFEEGGTLLDDFINVPTGTTVQNNEGETTTLHTRLNGLQEFQVGNEYFLVMAATMTNSNPPSAFALYKFADEARTFDGLEPLWYFPNDGLGSATNSCRTAVPSVEVNGNTATISIYAVANGYASYTLTVDDSDAPIRTEETATACDSYTWNGKTYTQSGTYTYTTTAANGNDSIVTLHLTISPILYTEETISACDSYVWNGQTYTEGGTYTYTTTSVAGCDSIVTLHLTINQKQYAEETISACDSYEWNGQTYTESGNYTYTTTTTNGCDSIITLYLTINHTEEGTTENATICHGETYTWNGQTYSTTGEYRVTLQNVGGCDSLVTLNLTVLPEVTYYTEYKTAPTNRTVTWRGKEYNETGLYYDTVHFVANTLCDSIIYILDLIVGDNIDSDKYCGENLTWYYSSGALIITGSGAMYDKPELLTYRNELWYPEHVNHIALPDGITHLGNVAFADCANLTNIAIPSSVTSIGDGVFSWTGLQSITIPANVTDLGEQIFESCSALSTLLYEGTPSSINNQTIHPFIGCVHLDTVIAPAALWHCTSADPALEARYGVPHKARYIEVTNGELTDKAMEYIAYNRGSLEVLDLTAVTNTTLPLGALMNSTSLSTLYLPQTIHTIPEMLAEGCHNLSEIIIPATVTEIGNHAFAGCTNVWQITSEAVLPPIIYPETFKDIDRSISVIVPAGSEDAYRQAPYWQEFFIEQTTDNAPALVNKVLRNDRIYILRNGKIYSIMGQQVQTTYIE